MQTFMQTDYYIQRHTLYIRHRPIRAIVLLLVFTSFISRADWRMHGRIDGQINGWVNGNMDGWTDGPADGSALICRVPRTIQQIWRKTIRHSVNHRIQSSMTY